MKFERWLTRVPVGSVFLQEKKNDLPETGIFSGCFQTFLCMLPGGVPHPSAWSWKRFTICIQPVQPMGAVLSIRRILVIDVSIECNPGILWGSTCDGICDIYPTRVLTLAVMSENICPHPVGNTSREHMGDQYVRASTWFRYQVGLSVTCYVTCPQSPLG